MIKQAIYLKKKFEKILWCKICFEDLKENTNRKAST